MTELEKIEYTKAFVDKLANGVNPMTGDTVPDYELINNVRVSRCLFYVSDLLRQLIENGGIQRQPKGKKLPFTITHEELTRYAFPVNPISVSEITKRINDLNQNENMMKLKYQSITTFLLQAGFLQETETTDGKTTKRPTPEGNALGITLDERFGQNGPYYVTVYNEQAQQFILDNIDAVIELNTVPKTKNTPATP